MKILISGSIVLYKSDKNVRRTINSFLKTSLDVKLFLIDNSPTQELKKVLADFIADPRVDYHHTNKNIGYGAAHNIAMREMATKSVYHLVLNPDLYFEPNVIETLYAYMEEHDDIGLVMPKVIYPSGEIQYLCKLLPAPIDLIFRRFLPGVLIEPRINRYEMRFSGYDKEMEVPSLSGCFMFMRTSMFPKVGYFDERFFLYLEDTDLSRRFQIHGKNVYYPEVEITHTHTRGSYKTFKLLVVHSISAVKYFNKWGWWKDKQRSRINNKTLQNILQEPASKETLKVKIV